MAMYTLMYIPIDTDKVQLGGTTRNIYGEKQPTLIASRMFLSLLVCIVSFLLRTIAA